MSYAFDDEEVATWTPDQPFPERIMRHKGMIYAHNAGFERLITKYISTPQFRVFLRQGLHRPHHLHFMVLEPRLRQLQDVEQLIL
jgi:hypothetical protein